ncbi:phosphate ABC transporter substrate-binding protein PstS [Acidicapsa dinghuensis]|uniref:Phosphate-binding protein n=1 Tax=Acidicapsa dinghuensis TaxID=2218256 RepID=A0ABW1EHU5_9BACT|nr:phosphate ABC transporter substrate-binding protein PstS [Acidicapsa dinghuensis]
MSACRKSAIYRTGYIAAIAVGLVALPIAIAQATGTTIAETGSTLIYPLFRAWIDAYAKVDPAVHMTAGATGSGAGIAQAIAKQVQIGTSDAYMSDNEAMANPQILNIPIAISAQTVQVNLPELRGRELKLSGPVLAGIYSGAIREWNANPIAELNPGVSLPRHAIVPVRRAESSGDTFIFTQFLSFSAEDTHNSWGNTVGYGTTANWPSVSGELTATGNQGMVQTVARTPYAVGYVGGSFQDDAAKAGLITAMLENQDGKFLLPTPATVTAAAAELTPRTPADERLTLVFAPGVNSYPLINYEYAMVAEQQSNQQSAQAIANFLLWCISPQGGSADTLLKPVHFIALPTSIRARSELQITKIH